MSERKAPSISGYSALLETIKERVRAPQVRASLAVNRELIQLYWSIGQEILSRRKAEGWGAKIIDRLGEDLSSEFPESRASAPAI